MRTIFDRLDSLEAADKQREKRLREVERAIGITQEKEDPRAHILSISPTPADHMEVDDGAAEIAARIQALNPRDGAA